MERKKVPLVSSNTKVEDTSPNVNLATTFTSLTRNNDWIIDSGATDRMTYDIYKFDQLSSKCLINTITNANGLSSPVVGIGI